MARRLHSEIEIQASPDRVWETLTDFAAPTPTGTPSSSRAPVSRSRAAASSSRCAFPGVAR